MTKRMDYGKRSRRERSNPELDKLDRERENVLGKLGTYLMSAKLSDDDRADIYVLINRAQNGVPVSPAALQAIEKKVRKCVRSNRKTPHFRT